MTLAYTHVFRLADGLAVCRYPDVKDEMAEKLARQLIQQKEAKGQFQKYYFIKTQELLIISTSAQIPKPLSENFVCSDLNLLSQPYQYQSLYTQIKNTTPEDIVQDSFKSLAQEVQLSKQLAEKNLSSVLERGQKLSDIETITNDMAEDSKNVLKSAKKLDKAAFLRKYGTIAAIGAVVLLMILLKIFK